MARWIRHPGLSLSLVQGQRAVTIAIDVRDDRLSQGDARRQMKQRIEAIRTGERIGTPHPKFGWMMGLPVAFRGPAVPRRELVLNRR